MKTELNCFSKRRWMLKNSDPWWVHCMCNSHFLYLLLNICMDRHFGMFTGWQAVACLQIMLADTPWTCRDLKGLQGFKPAQYIPLSSWVLVIVQPKIKFMHKILRHSIQIYQLKRYLIFMTEKRRNSYLRIQDDYKKINFTYRGTCMTWWARGTTGARGSWKATLQCRLKDSSLH